MKGTAPSDVTIKNYADWLINFLEWAEIRKVDLLTCEYAAHVQQRYQKEMLSGIWSRDGVGLSPTTVNLRVQQACDFLTWMADKGLRKPFDIATETIFVKSRRATSSVGHEGTAKEVRQGKVRQNKRRLRMPSDEQLWAWLNRVYERFGLAKGLMCEAVLLTAMRREEIACWRVDTLPEDKKDWHVNNPEAPKSEQRVLLTIRFGTKGSDYGTDHGDKIGPERSLWVPFAFAERLDDYRKKKNGRNAALKRLVKGASTLAEQHRRIAGAVHLFLDEATGERISSKQLYHAWTGVELPYKGWSPHLGRDWWACSTLWKEVQEREKLRPLKDGRLEPYLESAAQTVIRFIIRPQLGHTSDDTTMIYLQWFTDMIASNLSIDYEAELPAIDGEMSTE
ncbi:site-specific integrase [Paraburkholderia sp. D1E]|uniref:site-specific integrase n=1 Tax=Paraburkholderia sp. D1E TaxID=3461398 RepID=UPI00404651EE